MGGALCSLISAYESAGSLTRLSHVQDQNAANDLRLRAGSTGNLGFLLIRACFTLVLIRSHRNRLSVLLSVILV